ncbi:hypothetical protein Tco_1132056 [Tanacetum coccineum]|uniref:Uncharacterized protein n=1 Tax=Tanacetum coccineum TaxID=301880 RepID=A0ABQ5JAT6_9ASTR
MMDDPNITMEEYIRLEEEKAQKHRKVFNWETAKYGRIWYDEDVQDLRSVENEFPAIVFNDNLTSNETLSCEPTVSSLNDEIEFRISFDDSDDEDYTVVFDKNSFSYKIISTNDLKMDSENDNEKVNMHLFPSLEPTVSCIDDLDFFKYFENEFPAIVYNDALTSKSDLSREPTLCPQHIDEFDLKDETSLSEYDEKEQNILYFNDLFPFNIVYPDNLKSDKGNDDNKIDMIQSSGDMAPLPPHDQRHLWLHYQIEGYTEEIVHDFEQRLEMIFGRQVNRVHILDFEGLTPDMRQDLVERMRMVYTGDDRQEVFVSHAWRRLFGIRAPLVQEFLLEFFSTCRIRDELGLDVAGTLCFQLGGVRHSMTWRQFILALGLHTAEEMAEDGFRAYWLGSERLVPDKGDLSDYWVEISSGRDFLRGSPSYTYIIDPVRRLCHRLISYNISGRGKHLKSHAEGRKSGAKLFGGYFIGRLAHHFGLIGDEWAWVAPRPERQQVAAAGARGAVEDSLAVDEGVQADPTPMQTPQQPPPPLAAGRNMPHRLERLEEENQAWQNPVRTEHSYYSKGTRSNYAELDTTFEECYKALSEKLDWENPQGGDYPFDLSKPLPLITRGKRQRVPFEYFINNDLKDDVLTSHILENVPKKSSYSARVRGSLTLELKVIKRRSMSPSLILQDQISKRHPYTPYKDLKDSFMSTTQANNYGPPTNCTKFSDGNLTRTLLRINDITKIIDMEYLPKRRWSTLEKKRAHFMIKDINKLLKERRMMRSLEKFVGGRLYGTDLRLLQRTI